MQTQASNYTGNTHIVNKEVNIYTTQGTYDFNTGNALFTSRTAVKDSSGRVYIANNMALDNKSGIAQLEGNAIVKDSAGGYTVLSNQIFLNKTNNSFLATRKPVLIIKQKDDSIYVAADTIFSGFSTVVKNEKFILKKDSTVSDSLLKKLRTDTTMNADTMHNIKYPPLKNEKDSSYHLAHVIDSLNAQKNIQSKKQILIDSSKTVLQKDLSQLHEQKIDSLNEQIKKLKEKNIENKNILLKDSSGKISPIKDSTLHNISDSIIKQKNIFSANKKDSASKDSSRYFLAFHHVRIYNDSLQSVCDSLFFSAKDSVFRLFYDPVIWSGHSQITGDTIFLYTKNKKADRLYAFDKSMIINKTTQGFYNQIAGKTINGYFINGAIDYVRVKGSQAESVYYAQDEDSAYLGMNRATGDVIDLYFKNDDLQKVLFVNDIKGKFYPMKGIPEDQRYLKNFIWLNDKRPKNKLELFE